MKNKEYAFGLKIAIILLFYGMVFILLDFLKAFLDLPQKDYLITTLKLFFGGITFLYITPIAIGLPSRGAGFVNLVSIGLLKTNYQWKDLLLGFALGFVLIGTVLGGSLISGGYRLSTQTINFQQIYDGLVEGVFEEIIFRGLIMIILIRKYKNLKKAVAIQVIILVSTHVIGRNFLGLADLLTIAVVAVALSYVVYRTGHLYTAIIFHFIYSAFLLMGEVPEGMYKSGMENFVNNTTVCLGMIGVIIVTRLFTTTNNMHIYRRELLL